MLSERDYQIHPIVQDSVIHNSKTLSNYHALTSSLFGVTIGILGLESYSGFLLYLVLSTISTLMFYSFKILPESLAEGKAPLDTGRYFRGAWEVWAGGAMNGLSGFILTWTLFYGLVRA